jgi:hypothetical protein
MSNNKPQESTEHIKPDTITYRLLDSTLKYKVEEINYPKSGDPLINFAVVPTGVILLPMQGGIFMPNFNTWYLEPSKEPLLSVSPDIEKNNLYYSKNFSNTSFILLARKNNNKTEVVITDTFMKGFYNVIATGNGAYYVWGLNAKGFHIWQRSKNKRDLIFESNRPITAFTAINASSCLMCWDQKLMLLRKGKQPEVLDTLAQQADGIAVDGSGSIFVSAGNFIYKISATNNFYPVLGGIHGILQYLDGKLYVLWQEKREIVVFKFLSNDAKKSIDKATSQTQSMENDIKIAEKSIQQNEELSKTHNSRSSVPLSDHHTKYKVKNDPAQSKQKHVCPKCQGEGKAMVICIFCEGSKTETCSDCDGKKYVNCSSCGSTGKCNRCRGTGEVLDVSRHNDSRTSGKVTHKRCSGTGICIECHGRKKNDCTKCRGNGKVDCTYCKGEGQRLRTCPLCNGDKYVTI